MGCNQRGDATVEERLGTGAAADLTEGNSVVDAVSVHHLQSC